MSRDSQVLAVRRRQVQEYFDESRFVTDESAILHLLELIRSEAQYVERSAAEHSLDLTQIVACSIVYNKLSVLCIRRSPAEARPNLRLRHTIMFGGHVSENDHPSECPLRHCVARELQEELGLVPDPPPRLIGFVTDPFSASGRLHLGIVFAYEFAASRMLLRGEDRAEFLFRREAQKSITFLSWEQVRRYSQTFDSWSGTIIYDGQLPRLLGLPQSLQLPDLQLRLPEF